MFEFNEEPFAQVLEYHDLEEQINTWIGTFDNSASSLVSVLKEFELLSVAKIELFYHQLRLIIPLKKSNSPSLPLLIKKIQDIKGFSVLNQDLSLKVSYLKLKTFVNEDQKNFVKKSVQGQRVKVKNSRINPDLLLWIYENCGDDYYKLDEMNYDDNRSH